MSFHDQFNLLAQHLVAQERADRVQPGYNLSRAVRLRIARMINLSHTIMPQPTPVISGAGRCCVEKCQECV